MSSPQSLLSPNAPSSQPVFVAELLLPLGVIEVLLWTQAAIAPLSCSQGT